MDAPRLVINGEQVCLACPDGGWMDLGLVERLARLALEARRRGHSVCLHGPPPELLALLELCGLADLLPECRGGTC